MFARLHNLFFITIFLSLLLAPTNRGAQAQEPSDETPAEDAKVHDDEPPGKIEDVLASAPGKSGLTCEKDPQYISEPPFYVSSLIHNFDEQKGKPSLTQAFEKKLANSTIVNKGLPTFSIVRLVSNGDIEKAQRAFDSADDDVMVPVEVISLPNEKSVRELKTAKRKTLAQAGGEPRVSKRKSADQPGSKQDPLAQVGDFGRVRKAALQEADNFLFQVTEPTVLQQFPGLEPYLRNGSIRYTEKNHKYLAKKCCKMATIEAPGKCEYNYVFDVVSDSDPTKVLKTFVDNSECGLTQSLLPVQRDQIRPMRQILEAAQKMNPKLSFKDIEQFDGRFIKILTTPEPPPGSGIPVVKGVDYGPMGTIHYHQIDAGDPNNNDAWAHPMAACAFFKAAEAFSNSCRAKCQQPATACDPDTCIVQWGDFYHSTKMNVTKVAKQAAKGAASSPKSRRPASKNFSGHAEHQSGECVDIRLMRKIEPPPKEPLASDEQKEAARKKEESLFHGLSYQKCEVDKKTRYFRCQFDPHYDRDKTQDLVDFLTLAGGVGKVKDDNTNGDYTINHKLVLDKDGKPLSMPIYFNDVKGVAGVRFTHGHDDHLHVCFPANEPTVQNACLEGVGLK